MTAEVRLGAGPGQPATVAGGGGPAALLLGQAGSPPWNARDAASEPGGRASRT
ncbi:hypothetical protein [Micromonospora sp. MW-13]|uniref:hypothetical protein n=1 Tax=Micromonospora sp. MW-13 TaxID=2094022 RepID=UPI00140479A9|nr:hypothetical protein [Micromonospora sp. MW-13]